jgi:hypothetical protein
VQNTYPGVLVVFNRAFFTSDMVYQ